MASPYTQDINKTVEAIRKRDEPSYSSQLVSIFKQYQENQEANAQDNIDKLNTDFVFEKQALNNKIKGYNEILAIQEDVNTNYGGSTLAYAEALANKQYQNRLAQKLNAQGQEGFKIFNDYTAVGAQDYLSARTQKIKNDVDTMFNTAKSINLEENIDDDYVDSLFTQEINKLPTSLRGSGWGALGSLISGQGLKVGDTYDVTRQDILERVYSDIPEKELGELATQFQAYYTENPANAEKFANIIPNIKFGTDVKLHDKEGSEEFLGKTRRFHESYFSYTDKNGERQISSITRTPLNDDELFIDAGKMADFLANYSKQGQKIWNEENQKGTSLSDIITILNKDKNNFVNKDEKAIKETWFGGANQLVIKGLYETWAVGEGYATIKPGATFGKTTVQFKEGASEEEGFLTFEQYKKQNYKNELEIFGIEQTGTHTEMGDSTPIENSNGSTVAYVVDSTSHNNTLWKDSIRGTNMALTDDKDKKITLTQELTNALELEDYGKLNRLQFDYDNNINEEVTNEGLYFNKANPYILNIEDLEAIGIEASEPIEFGYDIKNEQFVMRSTTQVIQPPPEETEKTEVEIVKDTRDIVEKMNDVPYAGAVSEALLGPDLSIGDAVWLIPGTVGVKVAGKATLKAGLNVAARTIFAMPSTKKTIAEMVKRHGTGKFKMGFNTEKTYLKWFNALTPVQKTVVNSLSKSGKSIEYKVFYKNFAKIQGLRVMAYVPTTGKLLKWGTIGGIVAGGQYYDRSSRSIEDRAYNLDH